MDPPPLQPPPSQPQQPQQPRTISSQHQHQQHQHQHQHQLQHQRSRDTLGGGLRRRVPLGPSPGVSLLPPTSTTASTTSTLSDETDTAATTTDADTETDVSASDNSDVERKKVRVRRRKKLLQSTATTTTALKTKNKVSLFWPPSWFYSSTSSSPSSTPRSSSSSSTSHHLHLPSPPIHPRRKKTLVLDLDETLVHSTSMGSRHHDHIIEVLVDKHVCLYYVYKRPGVDAFLKKVAEWYKVVIFTASMPEYADPVIDWLDKDRTLISRRYFRQSCTQHENGHFTKDLSIVDQDLSSVVLLDNSAISFALNPENAIPIETWTHDANDEALFELLPFLDALRFTDDVRSVLGLRI